MAFKPLTVNTPIGEEAHILAEDDAALYDGDLRGRLCAKAWGTICIQDHQQ